MKKSILNLGIFIFLIFSLIAVVSCKKDKTDTKETVPTPIRESLEISDFYNSDCLNRQDGEKADTIGSRIFDRQGDDLVFQWLDFYGNCDADSFMVRPYLIGDTIEIWTYEYHTILPSCVCRYNVSARIKNLKPKRYLLKTYAAISLLDDSNSNYSWTWWDLTDSVWMNL